MGPTKVLYRIHVLFWVALQEFKPSYHIQKPYYVLCIHIVVIQIKFLNSNPENKQRSEPKSYLNPGCDGLERYLYTYMYLHFFIRVMYMYIQTCTNMCVYICIYVCIYLCVYMSLYTYIYIYTHMYYR